MKMMLMLMAMITIIMILIMMLIIMTMRTHGFCHIVYSDAHGLGFSDQCDDGCGDGKREKTAFVMAFLAFAPTVGFFAFVPIDSARK